MDGLSNRQRAVAWLATWNPSFVGKATINLDLTFRGVNNQFCEILTATRGELVDKNILRIMTPEDRELAQRNAILIKEKKSREFLLPVTYEMHDGHQVKVLLKVTGAWKEDGNLDFYTAEIINAPVIAPSSDTSNSQKESSWLKALIIDFPSVKKLITGVIAFMTFLGWVAWELVKAAKRDGIQLWP